MQIHCSYCCVSGLCALKCDSLSIIYVIIWDAYVRGFIVDLDTTIGGLLPDIRRAGLHHEETTTVR